MALLRFRAWDGSSLCRMYSPSEVMVGDSDIWIFDEDSEGNEWIINNDLVLMQSTGLIDKTGKEIFEGDIVDYNGRKAVVKWHGSYASFVYMFVDELRSRNQEWDPLYLSYLHFQVVGNKFETPALLEVDS